MKSPRIDQKRANTEFNVSLPHISPISILHNKIETNHKRNGSESSCSGISTVSFSNFPDVRNNVETGEIAKKNTGRRFSMKSLKSLKSLRWNLWQPTTETLRYLVTCFFFTITIWIICYILFDEMAVPPKGSLFVIILLEVSCIIFGILFESIRLPPLLGMISAGLLIGNLHIYAGSYFTIDRNISYPLRMISVVIVLIRGALSVNPTSIKQFIRIIPQLVIGSCLLEAATATLAVYYILQFPFQWATLIGCIMSAMSGVGLLPYLTAYERRGISDNRVILISRTACGLDALLAISMAQITYGFVLSEGNVGEGFKKGLAEVLIGALFGCFWGWVNGKIVGKEGGNLKRTLCVLSGGIVNYLGLPKLGFPRGAPLGCFLNALTASIIWSKNDRPDINKELAESFNKIWFLSQPMLFGIVGLRTNLHNVEWDFLLKGISCLAISLFVRFISVFALVSCGDLKKNEKLFLSLAWIPKCTVQATTGPVAFDTAIQLSLSEEMLDYGNKILALSVMTIVVATSFGALTSLTLGPKFLNIQR